jgi:hypothetical protein
VTASTLPAALDIDPVRLSPDTQPRLFVVVDTEEEFDWGAPFSRANTSVRAMRDVGRLQSIFSKYGIKPTYVVDFPIASQPDGYQPLKELADSGECVIGAHLHPWVNPPFVEDVTPRNSFGCRLGERVEMEKIRVLQAEIASHFGALPTIYKAGRYGFGVSTAAALEALDFTIDMSVNPQMNYSGAGGPSFEGFDTTPFVFGRSRLLEIPCTTDYIGVAGRLSPWVHRTISIEALQPLRAVGVMARLGVVNKVMLSPEGNTLDEMKALTRTLVRRGVRTFSLTMHSPSAQPGCTPYVRTDRDLADCLARLEAYCEFFLGVVGGAASTPHEFQRSLNGRLRRH